MITVSGRKDYIMVKKFNEILMESSLSRILFHIEKTPEFGVISPYRKENSDAVNKENYQKLADEIRKLGYGYIPLRGGYTGDEGFFAERSFFIPNIKRKEIVDLGIEYDQHSVIHKDKHEFALIGTNKHAGINHVLDKFIVDARGISVDDVGDKFKEFFSQLEKGAHSSKKFLFKLQEEIETSGYYRQRNGSEWKTIFED